MERLNLQRDAATKAFESLQAAWSLDLPHPEKRDVVILRFIYTFEAIWKLARLFLFHVEGIDANAPKSCIRSSFEIDLLSAEQAEAAIAMTDDRNLTVHIYNEELAKEIFSRVPSHIAVLAAWLSAMRTRLEGTG